MEVNSSGTYIIEVVNNYGCAGIDDIEVYVSPPMIVNETIVDESTNGMADGGITISVSGGLSPYYFYWSNSATSQMNSGLPAGNYSVTVADNSTCLFTQTYTIGVSQYISQPEWMYINTGYSHSILIQGTIPVTIDSIQISIGDYIGVFYDSLGTEVCAGYEVWNGQGLTFTAWGDNPQTTELDGFVLGEGIVEKIHEFSLRGPQLYQNVPNPFTNETEISFYLPMDCAVELEIFDLLGNRVITSNNVETRHALSLHATTPQSANFPAGHHTINFKNNDLPPGTYFYHLKTPAFETTRKMVVMKH